MLLVNLDDNFLQDIIIKYSDHIIFLDYNNFKIETDIDLKEKVIKFIESIKNAINQYDIVNINYSNEVVACLQAINIPYSIIYSNESVNDLKDKITFLDCEKIIIYNNNFEDLLKKFKWYEDSKEVIENLVNIEEIHHKKTLAELIEDDVEISDADVRDMKMIQTKLKMGVLLQAKSMLNRILRLTSILDKLYDELLVRVDSNITNTDTASLMYTIEFLSKALNETNQFIVSLINNEKIQNFFIIDNSTIINNNNTITDIDKRERIRKATEIVLNNIDHFVDGEYTKVIDPNDQEEIKE